MDAILDAAVARVPGGLAVAGRAFGAGVAWGQANYQGLWWNPPAESGWGINFAHQGDVIFATWFTYDGRGKPWWLIAELHKTAAGAYAGNVSTVTGPAFNAQPFDPAKVAETAVGTLAVTFASAAQGRLTYTVNGVTQTKTISKQVFGADPTCVWGQQANLAAATNYQDLWWNPAESGWGVNFTHQGDVIFATWFTYDAAGKPWWLIAELRQTAAGVYGGKVSTVKGPAFDAVPFDAGKVVETVVGEATVTFADGNHAPLRLHGERDDAGEGGDAAGVRGAGDGVQRGAAAAADGGGCGAVPAAGDVRRAAGRDRDADDAGQRGVARRPVRPARLASGQRLQPDPAQADGRLRDEGRGRRNYRTTAPSTSAGATTDATGLQRTSSPTRREPTSCASASPTRCRRSSSSRRPKRTSRWRTRWRATTTS